MKKVFVGNMSYDTGEDALRSAFEAFGKVDSVAVVRDQHTGQPRGFAFIEMADDAEAEKAIAGLNGSAMGGRTLNVSEARPKERSGFGGGGGGGRSGGGGRRGGGGGGRGGFGGGRGGGGGYGR